MTVGELKKILAQHEDDTELVVAGNPGCSRHQELSIVEPYLFDGEDLYDFDESKIDPGHLQKVLVF